MNAALRIQILVEQRKAQKALKDLERQLKAMGVAMARTGGGSGGTRSAIDKQMKANQDVFNWLNKKEGERERKAMQAAARLANTRMALEKEVEDRWLKNLWAREQAEIKAAAKAAAARRKLSADYNDWWQKALWEREQAEIRSAKKAAEQSAKAASAARGKLDKTLEGGAWTLRNRAAKREISDLRKKANASTRIANAMTKESLTAADKMAEGWERSWQRALTAQAKAAAARPSGGGGGGGLFSHLGRGVALTKRIGDNILGWGKNMQWTGRILSMRITAPLALMAGFGVKWAMDFERAMTRLQKVYGDLHMDQATVLRDTELLSEGFIHLSNIYGVAAEEVANLGAMWAAAGAQGRQLGELTELSLQTVILGDLDPAETVQSLITIMSAFKLNVDEARAAIDTLNIVENQSAAQMGDLIEVIAKAGGVASQSGVSIRELAASAAILVPASGSAEQAGNALRSIMFRIMAPTNQAAAAMNNLGLSLDTSSWQSLTFTQRLEAIADEYGSLSQAQKIVFARNVAQLWQGSRLISILEDLNSEQSVYRRLLTETDDATLNNVRTNQELQTVLSSGPRQFEILTNRARNFLMQAMIPLIPVINTLLTDVIKLTTWFSNLSPETQRLAFYFLGILALAGPLMSFVGVLGILLSGPIKAFALLGEVGFGAVGLLLNGFGLLGRGLGLIFGGIIRQTVLAAGRLVAVNATAAATVGGTWAALPLAMKIGLVAGFAALIGLLLVALWRMRHLIGEFLLDIARAIGRFFVSLARGIGSFFSSLFGGGGGRAAVPNGGPLASFANGTEDHRAQIARAGAMRLWAEPETGGEAYIPLASAKRARSTAVLDEVAGRFGFGLVKMAAGGILGGLRSARDQAYARHGNPQVNEDVRLAALAGVSSEVIRAAHRELGKLNAELRSLQAAIDAQEDVTDAWDRQLRAANKSLDALSARLGELQDQAGLLQDELSDAEGLLSDWLNAPIAGTYAMEDALWSNNQAQNAWRLEVAKAERAILGAGFTVADVRDAYARFAGTTDDATSANNALARSLGLASLDADEVKARMAALNGEIEGLRSRRLDLRLAGAGSEVLGALNAQISDIESQRRALGDLLAKPAAAIPPDILDLGKTLLDAEKALSGLELDRTIAELEGNLALDPIRKQIEDLQRVGEQSGESIIAGIVGSKAEIEQIRAALAPIEASIKEQERLVREAEAARDGIQASYDVEREKLDAIQAEFDTISRHASDIEATLGEITSLGSQLEQQTKAAADAASDFASEFAALGDGDFDVAVGSGLIPAEAGDVQAWVDDLQRQLEMAITGSPKDLGRRLGGNMFERMFNQLENQFGDELAEFETNVKSKIEAAKDRIGREFRLEQNTSLLDLLGIDINTNPLDFPGWFADVFELDWAWNHISSFFTGLPERIRGLLPSINFSGLMPDFSTWGPALGTSLTNMNLAEMVAPVFSGWGTSLRDAFTQPFSTVGTQLVSLFTGGQAQLGEWINASLFPFFGNIWTWFNANILSNLGFGSIGSRFLEIFTTAWQLVSGFWATTVQPMFSGWWSNFNLNILGGLAFGSIGGRFLGIFQGLSSTISNYWSTTIAPMFSNWWTSFRDNILGAGGFGSLGTRFYGIFENVKTLVGSALSGFKAKVAGPLNEGIGAVRSLVSRINDVLSNLGLGRPIPMPGFIEVSYGGGSFSGLARGGEVPTLARGGNVLPMVETKWGLVTSQARAIVGEGSPFHPEYVIPTDPRYRGRAAGLLAQANERLGGPLNNPLRFARGGVIPNYDIGGVLGTIADYATPDVVGRGLRKIGGAVRKGAVTALWKPLYDGVSSLINTLPDAIGGMVQGAPRYALNKADEWMRGVEAAAPKLAEVLLGGGAFTRYPSGWPAPRAGVLSPNAVAARAFIQRTWPQVNGIGGVGHRGNVSDHPKGKALDAMITGRPHWSSPEGKQLGNEIASWFGANSRMFGTKYIIWNDLINSGSGWRRYTHPSGNRTNPTLRHLDHVHISLFGKGGMLPYVGMANGGIVRGGRGGVLAHIGEGQRDEAVIPLGRAGLGRTINIYGDLEFPNVTGPEDVENFLANLEALAGD